MATKRKTLSVDELIVIHGTAKEQFTTLDGNRGGVLTRARDCALLTIPSVLPADGHEEEADMVTPYQGEGAKLVNSLAAKLLLTLLPPNTPFFRLIADAATRELAGTNDDSDKLSEINAMIVEAENEAVRQVERESLRVPAFEMFKAVIVTGNSLGYKMEKGLKVFRLDQYVVRRDFMGNPLEFITKENVSVESLSEEIQKNLVIQEDTLKVTIYTRAIFSAGMWVEYQEVEDVPVQKSEKEFKPEDSPYIPLRWTSINGENYGRGLVEQYLGDYRTLEALYQILIETAAVQARTLFGKKPGSALDMDDVNNAANGETVLADFDEDITVLRVDKGNDLQVPMLLLNDIKTRLEQAFLSANSVARDSERTTATEIRFMAADLEESLGGVYSILSLEFQKPLAHNILETIDVDLSGMEVVIVTGVEALGRNNDLEKLRQFNSLLQELNLPELVGQVLNIANYIEDMANFLGLNGKRYILQPKEVQEKTENDAENSAVEQGLVNEVTKESE